MTGPVLVARDFLVAGGRITYSEWNSLSEEQRVSFVEAGEDVIQEQADRIVIALAEALDGALEKVKLSQILDKAEKATG